MLEAASVDTFRPHVGGTFRVAFDEERVALELAEARPAPDDVARGALAAGLREPFSLVFRGPLEPLLDQRIWRLEHDVLGGLEIFLVPLGPDEHGQRYEAVFG